MTGPELAAIRKTAGLSQAELAQRAGIGRHAVSYWENRPSVDLRAWAISRMAKVLELPKPPALGWRLRSTWERDLEAQVEAAFIARVIRLRARTEAAAAKRRVICEAKTRKGTPCRCKSEPGKRRCKFHGGKSTGAKTPEGRERIGMAQRQRWAKWRAERLNNYQA
ncbi:helix-turn-helix protein [Rhodobacter aestuarii]|uniref:Helix-turn-helix domain-containing protein n=1 Tax=Rhodobacter aestuarii TaxID=453582 RepID=A0A1N7NMA5_9RHOB|nr:helix-turn-helix transcriptional regulator [Rhodobacter aestuarii]PTV94685.1 helix-turn-helix protein [Rhodobacter aestuarii]SIS99400.1 Helix-turn-helix domain-containing protein [Rhodobacter aestuarii]